MGRMPEDERRKVIVELFLRADQVDWDGLQPSERSTWYARWLDEPKIGGVLDAYMTREQARVWIKETPMKHYNRARSGIGPYANLVSSRLPDAPKLTRLVFGENWRVVPKSLRDKPNRCLITDGQQRVDMIWGPPRAIQSLVWAAINAVVDESDQSAILVVTRQGERLTDGQLARHRKMGELLHVPVHHVTAGASQSPSEATRP
jgi:hypothetical protein